ncbi:MAG: [citrate (pro-3S)-lyase] ligase [Clostridia bacterium]|nr:[citrate (pro-3S)-lyase] ligase [Clostridia bacterium]
MNTTILPVTAKETRLRKEMEALLIREGIRLDPHLDESYVLVDEDENVLAAGSRFGNTLRCLAVDGKHRGEGLMVRMASFLLTRVTGNCFLITKPENTSLMTELGFHTLAETADAVFMENHARGFESWLETVPKGADAAVVMNANPFTRGHRFLAEQAARESEGVLVFAVQEENGAIPFDVRLRLVREGLSDLKNVTVVPGGPYIVSRATFPSYFLKSENDAIRAHAALDTALFIRIAKALGIARRYLGEEPKSYVTGIYNDMMQTFLPAAGIGCRVIPRLEAEGEVISASAVRRALQKKDFETVERLVPESTWRYFQSEEAAPVLEALDKEKDVIHY